MEVIISIVGSLAAKAAEYTVDPAARQLRYLFKTKTKFLNLRTKVRDLEDARQRLQQSVDVANRKGEVIFDDVQRWLTEVNEKISQETETKLLEDEEKAMKRCFSNFFPDFKSRYLLSKKADKEADAITQLLTKKDEFKEVSYLPPVEVRELIRPVKEYEAFGSRIIAFDGVMAALQDDAISIIGVYGMGGVGKTTLVKEVAGQVREKLSFDEVVFVAVTQTANMVNIQKDIAEKVGMEFREEGMDARAARLRQRLMKEKRVLVVLDDIWESLDLRALGIPSADEHKGCKILMTSRRLNVLKRMDSHPNISIETLKEDETWTLFKKIAGQIVERPELQSTAVEVAKRCAGLPIAITTIAKALKPKETLFEWRDALRQLSNPSERNFKDVPADAYSAIGLSYKFLEDDELGPIFLLCSIMGHNAAVEDLLRYAIGLGFIHDVNTVAESRDRILTLVNNLKASCLLLEGSHPNCFDIHDVVRDVAQSIASRDLHWLALFKEWPNEEKIKESQLISLQKVEVSDLLNHELECPNLTYFSIYLDDSSLNISNNFFTGMQRLKVLEFDRKKFTTLPSSLGCLKTLCALRLRDCVLQDIGILGELGNLEILDLCGSRIAALPKEIGQLIRLKILDLNDCHHLKVISPNVLLKLSRLEELYLYGSFDKWEVEGTENLRKNASLVELQYLSRLTTLEVHIPDVEAIPKDNLFFGKMERYKISIGDEKCDSYYDRRMGTSRMLKLKMKKSIHLIDGIKPLVGKTHILHLDGFEDGEMFYHPDVESFGQLRFLKVENCNMLKNLFLFSIAKRLNQLEELKVSNCNNITELIVEEEDISENDILEFKKLRILKLEHLNRFNGLRYSKNTHQSTTWLFDKNVLFPALEELEVNKCPKLKYIFASSTVKSFVHLKTLEVSKCDKMEVVVEGTLSTEEGINNSFSVFPKLDSLVLSDLPQLNRFCCGMNPIKFSLLRTIHIRRCTEINTFVYDDGKSSHYFFNEKVMLPVLEELEIRYMYNLERLWPDVLVQHSFFKLTSIYLESCPKLLNVFPLSLLTKLQRLHTLAIIDCESIEEIIFGSESGGNNLSMDVITFEFPSLTSLVLFSLPNLKNLHHNKMHTINWPSLTGMRVSGCDRVETLFSSGEPSSEHPLFCVTESTFPNLKKLTLGWNAEMKEMIWHCQGQQQHQILSSYFPNLKDVILEWYPEQVTVLPSYLPQLLSLPNLQTLGISESSFKELIFQSQDGGEEKPASLLLSQITELRLEHLPELMHLWKEKEGFQNLRRLYVYWCPELKFNLVPSSVSFQNLMTGLIKLITPSTAKSLVQLKEMIIQDCENIEEIIQGGDNDDKISFPQLHRLELVSLPQLESFCSWEKYTFGFPALEILVVNKCLKMKMFSQGDSNTSLLHKGQRRWEGSLESTIQQLFREQECKNSEEDYNNLSTSTDSEECENYEEERETKEDQDNPLIFTNSVECENYEEDCDFEKDQSNPSTSNTQAQFMSIQNFEYACQQADDALSRGLELVHQSLAETLANVSSGPSGLAENVGKDMCQMAMAIEKLDTFQGFLIQADSLRYQTLLHMSRVLTTRKSARALPAMNDYFSRLRALGSRRCCSSSASPSAS